MRWKRVDNTKEENQLQVIDIKNSKKPVEYKTAKTKASFYEIEIKDNPKLNKKKVAIAFGLLLLVLVLIFIIVFTNAQQKRKEEERKAEVIRMQEEEKAKIEAAKEAERQAKLPKLTQTGIDNMDNIYNSETKRVFLTFDDGPSTNTTAILDILKQENIKATFFELGSRVEAQPELVKRAYDEGHFIASHGYSHVYSQIYQTPEGPLNEYNQCLQAIRNALGEVEYNPHLFRFPGGSTGGKYAEIKEQAKQVLKDNEVLSIDWNVLSGDAEGNNLSVDTLLARTNETLGEKNSVVILMHDSQTKATTVEALPQIIALFRDRGYEFMNFYEIIK